MHLYSRSLIREISMCKSQCSRLIHTHPHNPAVLSDVSKREEYHYFLLLVLGPLLVEVFGNSAV